MVVVGGGGINCVFLIIKLSVPLIQSVRMLIYLTMRLTACFGDICYMYDSSSIDVEYICASVLCMAVVFLDVVLFIQMKFMMG